RLRDPARAHVLLARQRLPVHGRERVAIRVLPERDRDVREVVARGAVLVHVAPRQHRDLVDRTEEAPRPAPLPRRVDAIARPRPRAAALVGALARAPCDRALALPARDRERRVSGRAAAGAAAVADLAEEGDAAQPEVARDLDLAAVLHRERDEPVDLAGRD